MFMEILLKFDLRVRGKVNIYLNIYLNIFNRLTLARISPKYVCLNLFGRAHFHLSRRLKPAT